MSDTAIPAAPDPAPEPPPVDWAAAEIDLATVHNGFKWPRGYGRTGPRGGQYLVVSLLLTTPAGRANLVYTALAEDGGLRYELRSMMSGIYECHSELQEPHGGQPCASWHPRYTYSAPEPDTLRARRAFAKLDGPRSGRGTVRLTIWLHHPSTGQLLEFSRTALECNLRRDLYPILAQVPASWPAPAASCPDQDNARGRLSP